MAQIAVSGVGGIVRQKVPNGATFPGFISASEAPTPSLAAPTVVEGVIEYIQEPPGNVNGGYLNLAQFLDRNTRTGSAQKKVNIFWLKILVGSGVAWALYVTNGKAGGDPATVVDLTADDAPLDSGTGSVAKAVSYELAPDERLRLVTAAVSSSEGVFQVHFLPVVDTYGRATT